MSLQRIIELARRQGMPMIITDVAGREPMVVLPLEVYEGMLEKEVEKREQEGGIRREAGGVGKGQRPEASEEYPASHLQPSPSSLPPSTPSRPIPPPIRPPQDGLRVRQRDEDRTQALHRSLDTVSQAVPNPQPNPSSLASGLVMEERFSFQP
jgi:hypothetical protein